MRQGWSVYCLHDYREGKGKRYGLKIAIWWVWRGNLLQNLSETAKSLTKASMARSWLKLPSVSPSNYLPTSQLDTAPAILIYVMAISMTSEKTGSKETRQDLHRISCSPLNRDRGKDTHCQETGKKRLWTAILVAVSSTETLQIVTNLRDIIRHRDKLVSREKSVSCTSGLRGRTESVSRKILCLAYGITTPGP